MSIRIASCAAFTLMIVVNRIGLTTSTKLGGAVVRSRLRRIMREGLRALEKEKTLKRGFLIVIAARSASVGLKSTEIKNQLDFAFKKLDMYVEQKENV